jgi:hypothetical protein
MTSWHLLRLLVVGLSAALLSLAAAAHDYRFGTLVVVHPYATPTAPGAREGQFYIHTLRNSGTQADRLLGARSPLAEAMEIRRPGAGGTAAAKDSGAVEIAPGAEVRLRPGGEVHLAMRGLKAPLKEGERVVVFLRFERAGEREVSAWIQRP